MLAFFQKYKAQFSLPIIGIYLLANFSIPFLEGVHFLLHLGDESDFHTFQFHQNNHQHLLLDNLESLLSSQNDTQFPIESSYKIDLLKKIYYQQTECFNQLISFPNQSPNFKKFLQISTTVFSSIESPPPEA